MSGPPGPKGHLLGHNLREYARDAQRFRMELALGQRVEPYASVTLRPKEGIRMTLAERSRGG